MRKTSQKAFALICVIAMLATMFVALPVSAKVTLPAPEVNIVLKQGDKVVTEGDIDVGETFEAYLVFSNMPAGYYVTTAQAAIAWDPAKADPVNSSGTKQTATNSIKNNSVIANDYFKTEGTPWYEAKVTAQGTKDCIEYMLMINTADVLGNAETKEEEGWAWDTEEFGITDFWTPVPANGTYTLFGVRLKRTSTDPMCVCCPKKGKKNSAGGELSCMGVANYSGWYLNAFGELYPDVIDEDGVVYLVSELKSTENSAAWMGDEVTDKTYTGAESPVGFVDKDGKTVDASAAVEACAPVDPGFYNCFFYRFYLAVPTTNVIDTITATYSYDDDGEKTATKDLGFGGLSGVNLKIANTVTSIPASLAGKDFTVTFKAKYKDGTEKSASNTVNLDSVVTFK